MEKPQWFQIAENDGPGRDIRATRKLPVLVLLSSLLVVGVGAVVAQSQDSQPAFASETAVIASNTSPAPEAQQSQGAVTDTSGKTMRISSQAPTKLMQQATSKPVANPGAPSSAPSIATMPTRGGGDDEDEGDDRHGGGHDDDEEDDD